MSARQEFYVDALRERLDEQHDRAYNDAERALADARDLAGRRDIWRSNAEQKLRDLVARLNAEPDGVRDNELESLKLGGPPTVNRWDTPEQDYAAAVEKADRAHARRVARLEALRPYTPEGESRPVLSMTPTMLQDVFGL